MSDYQKARADDIMRRLPADLPPMFEGAAKIIYSDIQNSDPTDYDAFEYFRIERELLCLELIGHCRCDDDDTVIQMARLIMSINNGVSMCGDDAVLDMPETTRALMRLDEAIDERWCDAQEQAEAREWCRKQGAKGIGD